MENFESLNWPVKLKSTVNMDQPNAIIPIFTGRFILSNDQLHLQVEGVIEFSWFPIPTVRFSCIVIEGGDIVETYNVDRYKILIEDVFLGEGKVRKRNYDQVCTFEGTCSLAILGDRSIQVANVTFSVPNLREFYGAIVKEKQGGYIHTDKARIEFDNGEYVITLDKISDYRKMVDNLKAKGGYALLYVGEIAKKNGAFSFSELQELYSCFNHFLYFINGSRTSIYFATTRFENTLVWQDFTGYQVDPYCSFASWSDVIAKVSFNQMWVSFSEIWKNKSDRKFLETAIHWYIEANNHRSYVETCLVMAQAALEIIYNWLIVEKMQIIKGKDAENIRASNKIRLLLSVLKSSAEIPQGLRNLYTYKNGVDGPESLVLIRNALIHGQEKKRSDLMTIPLEIKYEALQLAVWYIELAFLFIFNYRGAYYNRTSGKAWKDGGENVPWM